MNSLSDIELLILLNTAWYVLRLKKFFSVNPDSTLAVSQPGVFTVAYT